MKLTRLICLLSVCCLTSASFAAGIGQFQRDLRRSTGAVVTGGDNLAFPGNIATSGTLRVEGATTLKSTLAVTGTSALTGSATMSGALIQPSTAVSITNAAPLIAAAGKFHIVVTVDTATTGTYLTGATLGQVVMLEGTSNSNTVGLDDNESSLTLTGNHVLGDNDILWLKCTSADGDEWTQIVPIVNN